MDFLDCATATMAEQTEKIASQTKQRAAKAA